MTLNLAYRPFIYTIILRKSVCLSVDVIKLQVAILARSSREMCQTVRIDWKHILSRVRVSVQPRKKNYEKNTQNYREYRVARPTVYLNEAATGHCLASVGKGALTPSWLGANDHRTATT